MNKYPNELYHHGIKGMHWGVRNGPPYPLSPQTHAAVVRSGNGRVRARPVSRSNIGSIDNAIWLNKSNDDWNRVYYDPDTKKVMYGKQYSRSGGFKSANQIRRKELFSFGGIPGTGRGYGKKLLKDQKRLRNVYEDTKSASALKKEWNKMADEDTSKIKTWEKDQRKKRSRKTIRAIKKESKVLSKQYGYPVYAIYDYNNYTWRYAHSKSGRIPKLKPGEKIVR